MDQGYGKDRDAELVVNSLHLNGFVVNSLHLNGYYSENFFQILHTYVLRGIRAADNLVDEIAPTLFETADMRAGIDGLLEHGPRQFRNKVAFQAR